MPTLRYAFMPAAGLLCRAARRIIARYTIDAYMFTRFRHRRLMQPPMPPCYSPYADRHSGSSADASLPTTHRRRRFAFFEAAADGHRLC